MANHSHKEPEAKVSVWWVTAGDATSIPDQSSRSENPRITPCPDLMEKISQIKMNMSDGMKLSANEIDE